jgi:hypothetical protein
VSAACLDQRGLESFLADDLDRSARRSAGDHLRDCGDCRLRALEADPSVVFRLALSPEPAVSAEESQEILENVRIAIAIRQASRKIERPPLGGLGVRRTAAALAAAALLSLTASSPMTRRSGRSASPSPVPSPPAAAFAHAASPDRSDDALAPATARVYEWNPASNSPDDPKIVWIVDRSLDL